MIHFLQYGLAPCKGPTVPKLWPEGERWSGNIDDVTCPVCIDAVRMAGETPTYRVEPNSAAVGGHTITCLRCKRTSFSSKDVEHHYCGWCEVYHDDLWPPCRAWWLKQPPPERPHKGHGRGAAPRPLPLPPE